MAVVPGMVQDYINPKMFALATLESTFNIALLISSCFVWLGC
jgi:hypothetical protein